MCTTEMPPSGELCTHPLLKMFWFLKHFPLTLQFQYLTYEMYQRSNESQKLMAEEMQRQCKVFDLCRRSLSLNAPPVQFPHAVFIQCQIEIIS